MSHIYFCSELFVIFNSVEICAESASLLVDIIFETLYIYEDRGSKKAVDDVIAKGLQEVTFMKSFAAAVVQIMEKNVRLQSHVGGHRLLQWSCLLLSKSKFATVSKNALCRVATVQALLLHIVVQRSFSEQRACKKTFYHLFSQVWPILFQFIFLRSILQMPFYFLITFYVSHFPSSRRTSTNCI